MPLPTLVITPGAWHTPACFSTVQTSLEALGYKCVPIHMPSVGRDDAPVTSLDEDIAAVRDTVSKELDAGKDVVVVAHSWSGLPVSSALGGLGKKQRGEGKKGVLRIAFIAAFVQPEGVSLIDALGGEGNIPGWWDIQGPLTFVKDPKTFYNDLPTDQISHWGSKLQSHSLATKKDKSRGAAWKEIPSSYMLCEQDLAIPVFAQEGMTAAMKEAGAEVEVIRVESGHSPFLSMPERVVEFVRRAAGEDVEVKV